MIEPDIEEIALQALWLLNGLGLAERPTKIPSSCPWLVNATEIPKLPAGSTSPWLVKRA